MPRDSTERRRIVVVHLADEPPAAARILAHRFGRRGPWTRIGRDTEREDVVDPKGERRLRDAVVRVRLFRRLEMDGTDPRDALEELVETSPADPLDEQPQQDEAEVAVDRFRSRLVLERHRADVVLEFAA